MPDLFRSHLDTDEHSDWGELLDLLTRRPTWHADALCHEYPTVNFFPGPRSKGTEAKAVCGRCLVVRECREWSLAQPADLDGIFGGLGPSDRAAIRAARRAA